MRLQPCTHTAKNREKKLKTSEENIFEKHRREKKEKSKLNHEKHTTAQATTARITSKQELKLVLLLASKHHQYRHHPPARDTMRKQNHSKKGGHHGETNDTAPAFFATYTKNDFLTHTESKEVTHENLKSGETLLMFQSVNDKEVYYVGIWLRANENAAQGLRNSSGNHVVALLREDYSVDLSDEAYITTKTQLRYLGPTMASQLQKTMKIIRSANLENYDPNVTANGSTALGSKRPSNNVRDHERFRGSTSGGYVPDDSLLTTSFVTSSSAGSSARSSVGSNVTTSATSSSIGATPQLPAYHPSLLYDGGLLSSGHHSRLSNGTTTTPIIFPFNATVHPSQAALISKPPHVMPLKKARTLTTTELKGNVILNRAGLTDSSKCPLVSSLTIAPAKLKWISSQPCSAGYCSNLKALNGHQDVTGYWFKAVNQSGSRALVEVDAKPLIEFMFILTLHVGSVLGYLVNKPQALPKRRQSKGTRHDSVYEHIISNVMHLLYCENDRVASKELQPLIGIIPEHFMDAFNNFTLPVKEDFIQPLLTKLQRLPCTRMEKVRNVCNSVDGGDTIPGLPFIKGPIREILCVYLRDSFSKTSIDDVKAMAVTDGMCRSSLDSIASAEQEPDACPATLLFILEKCLQVCRI